jgi:hypothetical protein
MRLREEGGTMKQSTLLWIGAAILLFYFFSKSQAAAASTKLTENEYYAGTAAGVIEDLF